MNVQELETNYRSLQVEATELQKQEKALDARIQRAYARLIDVTGDEWAKIDDEIATLEQEKKALSKRTIHALNLANEAVVAWKKAEREANA